MLTFRFGQMRFLMSLEPNVVRTFLLTLDIWAHESAGVFPHMFFVLGFVGIFLHVCLTARVTNLAAEFAHEVLWHFEVFIVLLGDLTRDVGHRTLTGRPTMLKSNVGMNSLCVLYEVLAKTEFFDA